jgi:PAS domain S-box-containing protein
MPPRDASLVQRVPVIFSGGGEMGARMRAFDWDRSPLGPPQRWAAALQTTLGILLSSQHPMFIFWGPEHRCFYNDAYAMSIGPEKHALMLGAKGSECWSETWHVIGPQIDFVMSGRGSTWHENQLIPLVRHGRREDAYWTYGYSPIPDAGAAHGIGGVLVVCTETTQQVLSEQRQTFLVELDDALRRHNDARRIVATAIEALGRHLGVNRVGYGQVLPDDENIVLETNFTDGVTPVIGTFPLNEFGAHNVARQRRGETVVCDDVSLDPLADATPWTVIETRGVVAVPLVRDGRFRASLFVNVRCPRVWSGHEVALIERVAARIWDAVERAQAEAQLLLTTHRFELALQGSFVTLAYQDLDLRYTWLYNRALNFHVPEALGRTDAELFPAEDAATLMAIKHDVIRSRERRRQAVSVRVRGVQRHFDLLVEPMFGGQGGVDGVRCAAFDITDMKKTEIALRESEERMRLAAEATAVGLWEWNVESRRFWWDTQMFLIYGRAPTDDMHVEYHAWSAAVLPEDLVRQEMELRTTVESCRASRREFRIRRLSDGAVRHLRTVEMVRTNARGEAECVVGTTLDITERQRAEAQHQATFDNAAVGIAHVGLNGRWLRVNDQLCAIVGYTREELLQLTFADITHPDDIAANEAKARALIAGEIGTYSMEKRYIRRSGETVWVGLTVSLMRDQVDAPDYCISVMVDITARKAAELAVIEREERLATLANAMPQLVWIGRPDGSLEYVNRRLCEYTGLSDADAKAHGSWAHVIHPEDEHQSMAAWSRGTAKGEPYALEHRLRGHDGVYRWFLVRAQPERDSAGRILRWYGTCTDIDDAKRLEKHLLATEAALRDVDMRKDLFLATLSHELRNPLAPIRNAAQILGSPSLPPQRLQWAQNVIQRQVKHMAWLLDDLLDVARITRGKLELKKARVALTSIVDAAVEAARPLLDDKKHHLSVNLPSTAPILDADPLRLSQVLSNLLTNAAKYTDPGGHIEVSGHVEGSTVRLTVKDDGIGIPEESLHRIFDMFSQVDGRSAHSDGGLGIGLSLVKGLVDLHGGTTSAASAGRGRGSEFTVRLPLCAATPDGRPAAHAEAVQPAAAGRRVLIADDNKDAADSLAMLLEMDGHEVRVAHGGRAALALAQAFRPEVALLDIGMPDVSGYEVAATLRREPWGTGIHLVALTGWGQEGDRRRSQDAGFDRHLTKPIDPDALSAILSR